MLPKLNVPIFEATIPSTKQPIKFRPMRVSDEKILLMAKETNSSNEIFKAVKQVINNCMITENLNVDHLALFDIEYLFLKIRSASIGKDVKVTYLDNEDKLEYNFNIDLETIEVKFPENADFNIPLGDNRTLVMKYPVGDIYNSPVFQDEKATATDVFNEVVVYALDKLFEGEKVIPFKDHKPAEIREFVNNLDLKTYNKIKDFVNDMPSLYHEIKYKNKMGTEREIVLRNLTDFFTLG